MHLSSGRTAWCGTDRNSGFDEVHEGIGRVSISRTHHLRSLVQPNGAGQSDHGPTNRLQQPPYKPAELLELEPYYASQRRRKFGGSLDFNPVGTFGRSRYRPGSSYGWL